MKYKKSIVILVTAAMLALGTTGCAENQIPEFTDEEIQAVGEYVAITMMKYDMKHRSRLMELSETSENDSSEPQETEEPAGMRPVDDTPVVDASGNTESSSSAHSASSFSDTVEEVLGLPEGVKVTFRGQEFYDSYPEGSDFFSLGASDGKKLLVLSFDLKNEGAAEQSLDLLSLDAVFTVTINGSYSRKALTTMLLDDLSTFTGVIPASGSSEAVLVIEVDADMADSLSDISLNVKSESKSCTIQLF